MVEIEFLKIESNIPIVARITIPGNPDKEFVLKAASLPTLGLKEELVIRTMYIQEFAYEIFKTLKAPSPHIKIINADRIYAKLNKIRKFIDPVIEEDQRYPFSQSDLDRINKKFQKNLDSFLILLKNSKKVMKMEYLKKADVVAALPLKFTDKAARMIGRIATVEYLIKVGDRHLGNYMARTTSKKKLKKIKEVYSIDLEDIHIIKSEYDLSSDLLYYAIREFLKTKRLIDETEFINGVHKTQLQIEKKQDKLIAIAEKYEGILGNDTIVSALQNRIEKVIRMKPIALALTQLHTWYPNMPLEHIFTEVKEDKY